MLTCVLSGIAVAMAMMTLVMLINQRADLETRLMTLDQRYKDVKLEERVLQERLSDMKVELVKRGISLSDH